MLDTGNNLVLSVETDRTINLNSSRYFLGVEGDKEVKIIRFQLDRYYCGIDLSVFKPRVNYKLSNSKNTMAKLLWLTLTKITFTSNGH